MKKLTKVLALVLCLTCLTACTTSGSVEYTFTLGGDQSVSIALDTSDGYSMKQEVETTGDITFYDANKNELGTMFFITYDQYAATISQSYDLANAGSITILDSGEKYLWCLDATGTCVYFNLGNGSYGYTVSGETDTDVANILDHLTITFD